MTQEEIIEKEAKKYTKNNPFKSWSDYETAYKAGIKEAISNPGKYNLQPLTDSKELVEVYDEYIKLLDGELSITTSLCATHGYKCEDWKVKKGKELRERISNYKTNSPKELDSDWISELTNIRNELYDALPTPKPPLNNK